MVKRLSFFYTWRDYAVYPCHIFEGKVKAVTGLYKGITVFCLGFFSIIEMFFKSAISSFCTAVTQLYLGTIPVFTASFAVMLTVFFSKMAWAAFLITVFRTADVFDITSGIIVAIAGVRGFDNWMPAYLPWNGRRGFLEEISNTSDWKNLCQQQYLSM